MPSFQTPRAPVRPGARARILHVTAWLAVLTASAAFSPFDAYASGRAAASAPGSSRSWGVWHDQRIVASPQWFRELETQLAMELDIFTTRVRETRDDWERERARTESAAYTVADDIRRNHIRGRRSYGLVGPRELSAHEVPAAVAERIVEVAYCGDPGASRGCQGPEDLTTRFVTALCEHATTYQQRVGEHVARSLAGLAPGWSEPEAVRALIRAGDADRGDAPCGVALVQVPVAGVTGVAPPGQLGLRATQVASHAVRAADVVLSLAGGPVNLMRLAVVGSVAFDVPRLTGWASQPDRGTRENELLIAEAIRSWNEAAEWELVRVVCERNALAGRPCPERTLLGATTALTHSVREQTRSIVNDAVDQTVRNRPGSR